MFEAAVKIQRNEITESFIYRRLARTAKRENSKRVLEKMADEEAEHYELWRVITKKDFKPNRGKIAFYYFLSRFLGLNFGLRLMERGERMAQGFYGELKVEYPEAARILEEEQRHEANILGLIDDSLLKYISSIVLGLNDALIELTGALAGFTLALQNTRLIAVIGFIVSIAASFSMASAEYLSRKEESDGGNALTAGIITGLAYVATVLILISPYFFIKQPIPALLFSLGAAILIILIFTFYTSVARNLSFKRKFLEMASISFGVAVLNFLVGYAMKKYLGVEG